MAKIVIEFDTISKEMVVGVDGMKIENVVGVNICPDYEDPDEYHCCLNTQSEDETSDIKIMTMMYAQESKEGKQLIKEKEVVAIAGFVSEKKEKLNKVESDIVKHFSKE